MVKSENVRSPNLGTIAKAREIARIKAKRPDLIHFKKIINYSDYYGQRFFLNKGNLLCIKRKSTNGKIKKSQKKLRMRLIILK